MSTVARTNLHQHFMATQSTFWVNCAACWANLVCVIPTHSRKTFIMWVFCCTTMFYFYFSPKKKQNCTIPWILLKHTNIKLKYSPCFCFIIVYFLSIHLGSTPGHPVAVSTRIIRESQENLHLPRFFPRDWRCNFPENHSLRPSQVHSP